MERTKPAKYYGTPYSRPISKAGHVGSLWEPGYYDKDKEKRNEKV